jgi:hypothetical protein
MPLATPVGGATEHHDLKSCPPDGYVVLRRLTHGEKMARRGLLAKARMETGSAKNRSGVGVDVELMNEKITLFEFSRCIVEHNLTYLVDPADPSSETLLDFRIPDHVRMIDGNIGEEIDALITEINDWESDEDTGK